MDRDKLLLLALSTYCISMFFPGVSFIDRIGTHSMYGIYILAFGWVAMVEWVFAWFANPLFLFAVFRSRIERPGTILIVSIIAFFLGLSAYTMRTIPNFSGTATPEPHLAVGYYIWMLSLGLFVLYGFQRYTRQENNAEGVVQPTRIDFSTIFRRYAGVLIALAIMLGMLIYALKRSSFYF